MSRRASTSIHPFWIFGVVIGLAAVLGGSYFIYGWFSDPYRTTPVLEVGLYLENSNSLRGNNYKVVGTIANSLSWSPVKGRLFSVEVENNSCVLPVLIPISFNHVNIQKGQRFIFHIEIDEKGILRARDLQKA